MKRALFTAWSRIDYGRSLLKPAAYAFLLAMTYGLFYLLDMVFQWGLVDFSGSAQSWLTPFYYSVVTYTTLGFGDHHAAALARGDHRGQRGAVGVRFPGTPDVHSREHGGTSKLSVQLRDLVSKNSAGAAVWDNVAAS